MPAENRSWDNGGKYQGCWYTFWTLEEECTSRDAEIPGKKIVTALQWLLGIALDSWQYYHNGRHAMITINFPQRDNSSTMMTIVVWRLQRVNSVYNCPVMCRVRQLCTTIHTHTHTREQFLQLYVSLASGFVFLQLRLCSCVVLVLV